MAWIYSAQARKYINKNAPNLKRVIRSPQALARLAKAGWNDLEYARTEEGLLYNTDSIDRANLLAGYWGARNASAAGFEATIQYDKEARKYRRELRERGWKI